MSSHNWFFNTKFYWRMVLLRDYVDQENDSECDGEVETLLAFFGSQPPTRVTKLSLPRPLRERKAA